MGAVRTGKGAGCHDFVRAFGGASGGGGYSRLSASGANPLLVKWQSRLNETQPAQPVVHLVLSDTAYEENGGSKNDDGCTDVLASQCCARRAQANSRNISHRLGRTSILCVLLHSG